MGVLGALLKNRRAGEAKLAWYLPNLSGPDTLVLTSEAFGDGQAIPAEHAGKRAGGKSVSPQLAWNAPPEGTAELLLVVEDADAPMPRPFVHCVALIDPGVRELPSGALAAGNPAAAPGIRVLRSGMGRGYLGPEPIKGHGPHHYTFQLFALAAAAGDGAPEQARPRALLSSIRGPVLAKGRLTGVYER